VVLHLLERAEVPAAREDRLAGARGVAALAPLHVAYGLEITEGAQAADELARDRAQVVVRVLPDLPLGVAHRVRQRGRALDQRLF
jgi:hypothetical protein